MHLYDGDVNGVPFDPFEVALEQRERHGSAIVIQGEPIVGPVVAVLTEKEPIPRNNKIMIGLQSQTPIRKENGQDILGEINSTDDLQPELIVMEDEDGRMSVLDRELNQTFIDDYPARNDGVVFVLSNAGVRVQIDQAPQSFKVIRHNVDPSNGFQLPREDVRIVHQAFAPDQV